MLARSHRLTRIAVVLLCLAGLRVQPGRVLERKENTMRVFVSFLAVCFTTPAFADSYGVNITRVGADIYEIVSEDIFIHTTGCYKYVTDEGAFLEMRGFTGELDFTDSGGTCEVRAVYGRRVPEVGNYPVTISQSGYDWYEIRGQSMYIKTHSCSSRALGKAAVLSLSSGGDGTLLVEGDECTVEGVYSRMQM